VRHARGAARAEGKLAGLCFGETYEVRYRFGGNRRVHRQHARDRYELRHRIEILDRIVSELVGETDVRTVRARRRHQPGITVGRRFRRKLATDLAVGARTIVDDDLLVPQLG